jgi:phosphoserine phosphatase RsbU/P
MHQVRCAEIWGGTAVAEGDICTPGICAAIHSSASGAPAGGDIYYFSVCKYESLTRIAIADVRGHGHAVNHLSRWLYEALERRMNDTSGARVLEEMNSLAAGRGLEAITTAAVATFHREKRTLSYAYAGHPPMLLGRAGQGWTPLPVVEKGSGPENLPLGALGGTSYTEAHVKVEPGDRLFVATDGVRECPNANQDLYGDDRLRTLLDESAGAPLVSIRQQLQQDLLQYANGKLDHDDCTFLLMEVLPPPVPFWKRWRSI